MGRDLRVVAGGEIHWNLGVLAGNITERERERERESIFQHAMFEYWRVWHAPSIRSQQIGQGELLLHWQELANTF